MFIYPNTTIKILHNVPLDPTYEHTIYFYSKAQQSAYFSSKAKYTLNNQTYQRVKKGWMRVNIQAEYLYNCNYLMFQNSAFGTKWFYAFIKQVEYVNDAVSEIFFEIDVMQTWHFDYLLAECFVDREHSISDEFGEHYLDEGLDIGDEYQITSSAWHFSMNEQNLCILMPRIMQGVNETPTQYIGNISMPMAINDTLYAENTQAIDAFLRTFPDVNNIEMMYQYPRRFYNANHQPTTEAWFVRPYFHPEHGNGSYMEGLMSGSYQPRNNKLYCYPYNFILMSNNSGQTATYRWENWRDHEKIGRFMVTGCYISTPMAMVYPEWYRGIQMDYDSGLVYDAFPQVAWSSDAFRSWWAQKAGAAGVGIINKVLGAGDYVRNMSNEDKALLGAGALATGAGLATAATAGSSTSLVAAGAAMSNPVTAGVTIGAGMLAYRLLSKVRDAYYAPNQLNGQVQTNSLNNNMSKCRFTAYYCTIKKEYAEAIDDYFDRYGYACRRNKKPFRVARKYWTYTKTVNCTLIAQAWDGAETSIIQGEGGLAQDDAQAICNIYNTGITFWRYDADNGVDVGNYSQDNRVKVWHFPNIS